MKLTSAYTIFQNRHFKSFASHNEYLFRSFRNPIYYSSIHKVVGTDISTIYWDIESTISVLTDNIYLSLKSLKL